MPGLNCDQCDGDLIVAGIDLRTEAWCVLDLSDLWMPADVRGGDRLLPGATGVIAFRRRRTVTRHSLPMVITGEVNRNGVENADVWIGLQENIAYLRTNLIDPLTTGNGLRSAVLIMPDSTSRSANVHMLGLKRGRVLEGRMLATLEMSIPAGVFA